MKRLFAFLAVVGLLTFLPLMHAVQGDDTPVEKFDVCHNGHLISVDFEGIVDHLDHGDCAVVGNPPDTNVIIRLFAAGL